MYVFTYLFTASRNLSCTCSVGPCAHGPGKSQLAAPPPGGRRRESPQSLGTACDAGGQELLPVRLAVLRCPRGSAASGLMLRWSFSPDAGQPPAQRLLQLGLPELGLVTFLPSTVEGDTTAPGAFARGPQGQPKRGSTEERGLGRRRRGRGKASGLTYLCPGQARPWPGMGKSEGGPSHLSQCGGARAPSTIQPEHTALCPEEPKTDNRRAPEGKAGASVSGHPGYAAQPGLQAAAGGAV